MVKTKNHLKTQVKPKLKKTSETRKFKKIITIKKILVPLDGSKYSFHALDVAISLSSHYSSSIIAVYVFDLPISLEFGVIDPVGERLKKKILGAMKTAKLRCKEQNIPFKSIMTHGKVEPGIIDVSKKEKCDIIVVGKRGKSSVAEIFLGSVSHYVIHHSKIPVIIVK